MEIHPDSTLRAQLKNVNQHTIILLRRIKDLEISERWLLQEKHTAAYRRKQELKIMNEKLKEAEVREHRLDQKLQGSTAELVGLKNENKDLLQKVYELEAEKKRNREEIGKLIEMRGGMEAKLSEVDKFKTPKLQEGYSEALKNAFASDRKKFDEELRKTKEYAQYITGIAKNQQERMNKWHIDDFNAESQRRTHIIKDLTQKLERVEVKAKTEMNLMEIKVRSLTKENENLRKQFDDWATKPPQKRKSDQIINNCNVNNGKEEVLSPKEDKGAEDGQGEGKGTSQEIPITDGKDRGTDIQHDARDNQDQNEEPDLNLKRARLGEHSVQVAPLKKQ